MGSSRVLRKSWHARSTAALPAPFPGSGLGRKEAQGFWVLCPPQLSKLVLIRDAQAYPKQVARTAVTRELARKVG